MNTNFAGIITFTIGAAIGSLVTWKLVKDKYKRIADEEIESYKEVVRRKQNANVKSFEPQQFEPKVFEPKKFEPTEKIEHVQIVRDLGYSEEKGEVAAEDKPYVIMPEEFGERDYETVSLVYYAGDEILADDDMNIVEDVEAMVGVESLTHFGEYEDDSVFVRNEKTETDYEILLDAQAYSDVVKKS